MQDMPRTTDVLIVGGGVIGCAIAYYLCQAGAEVILLDQGEVGAEASSAAAGLLAPLGSLTGPGPFADLLLASWSLFPALVADLEEVSGVQIEYEQTGALRVVRNPRNIANLKRRMQAWEPLGLRMDWLIGDEARSREPLLAPDVHAAVYASQEAQVRAPRLVKALAQAATTRGARFYSQQEITGVQRHASRVTGVNTAQGETIACEHLVIAAGAWTRRCGEWLDINIPISPLRGQILSLLQPTVPLRHMIFGEAIYLAPKLDNTITVGATKEEVGFDRQITAGGISGLLNAAIRLAPALAACSIETMWTGLRPRSPDQQPILGKAPGWENVTLATGHGSVGIMLSAITGKTVAELVTTNTTPEIIRAFGVERFASEHHDDAHCSDKLHSTS
ncbi:MAG: glycine oxidase ThiO [Chloroflexota bacterium]|nr:glycine oxidase ThiO [Chloroflexota bacterium]